MSRVTVRPAQADDLSSIAHLLRQLYAAELPGALSGPVAGQENVLRFTLDAKNQRGLQRRYVACLADGQIVATAAMEVPGEVPYERAPDGTIGMALKEMGYGPTLRLLLTVARSMVGGYRPPLSNAAFLHSVVVDDSQRGQGVGRALVHAMEAYALAAGYSSMLLQVLATNQPAQRLYAQLGYQQIWQSPPWSRLVSWPSYVLQKSLTGELPKAKAPGLPSR